MLLGCYCLFGFLFVFQVRSFSNSFEIDEFELLGNEYKLCDYINDFEVKTEGDEVDLFLNIFEDNEDLELLLENGGWVDSANRIVRQGCDYLTKMICEHGDTLSSTLGAISSAAGKSQVMLGIAGATLTAAAPFVPYALPAAGFVNAASVTMGLVKDGTDYTQKGTRTLTAFAKGYQKDGVKGGLKQAGKEMVSVGAEVGLSYLANKAGDLVLDKIGSNKVELESPSQNGRLYGAMKKVGFDPMKSYTEGTMEFSKSLAEGSELKKAGAKQIAQHIFKHGGSDLVVEYGVKPVVEAIGGKVVEKVGIKSTLEDPPQKGARKPQNKRVNPQKKHKTAKKGPKKNQKKPGKKP